MKKISNILLSLILSLSVISFAKAGELSVTGSVQATTLLQVQTQQLQELKDNLVLVCQMS